MYPLSLHDALPISEAPGRGDDRGGLLPGGGRRRGAGRGRRRHRSEEHTSELQSREKLVCRPLLEKKNFAAFKNAFLRGFFALYMYFAFSGSAKKVTFSRLCLE